MWHEAWLRKQENGKDREQIGKGTVENTKKDAHTAIEAEYPIEIKLFG
jgi:hypothetical protein